MCQLTQQLNITDPRVCIATKSTNLLWDGNNLSFHQAVNRTQIRSLPYSHEASVDRLVAQKTWHSVLWPAEVFWEEPDFLGSKDFPMEHHLISKYNTVHVVTCKLKLLMSLKLMYLLCNVPQYCGHCDMQRCWSVFNICTYCAMVHNILASLPSVDRMMPYQKGELNECICICCVVWGSICQISSYVWTNQLHRSCSSAKKVIVDIDKLHFYCLEIVQWAFWERLNSNSEQNWSMSISLARYDGCGVRWWQNLWCTPCWFTLWDEGSVSDFLGIHICHTLKFVSLIKYLRQATF